MSSAHHLRQALYESEKPGWKSPSAPIFNEKYIVVGFFTIGPSFVCIFVFETPWNLNLWFNFAIKPTSRLLCRTSTWNPDVWICWIYCNLELHNFDCDKMRFQSHRETHIDEEFVWRASFKRQWPSNPTAGSIKANRMGIIPQHVLPKCSHNRLLHFTQSPSRSKPHISSRQQTPPTGRANFKGRVLFSFTPKFSESANHLASPLSNVKVCTNIVSLRSTISHLYSHEYRTLQLCWAWAKLTKGAAASIHATTKQHNSARLPKE